MSDETRLNILRILSEEPDISQRELARRLGVSLGKANYCIRALIDKGLVKAKNFKDSNSKATYLYVLTLGGMEKKAELTAMFLQQKMKEYDALNLEIERLYHEVHGVPRSITGDE